MKTPKGAGMQRILFTREARNNTATLALNTNEDTTTPLRNRQYYGRKETVCHLNRPIEKC